MTRPGPERRLGRPRTGVPARPDLSPADQILDAAAELFVERGYAATTTRAVAERVGVRQASLYYHFASKEAVLAELLQRTVRPAATAAEVLERLPERDVVRLHALATYDARVLAGSPTNVGALYLLPEVRGEQFADFRRAREALRGTYRALLASAAASGDLVVEDVHAGTAVLFALVESVILARSGTEPVGASWVDALADAGLRALRCPEAGLADVTAQGRALADRLAREVGAGAGAVV